MTTTQRKTVLFNRSADRFTGGVLKVWDYFNHTRLHDSFDAAVYLRGNNNCPDSPWISSRSSSPSEWDPNIADVLFVAGMDWAHVGSVSRSIPIVNLVQHVRHGDPRDPRYAYLNRKAVRICVSEEVASVIRDTRKVNGPLFTIPNCIDFSSVPEVIPRNRRTVDILIAGAKSPVLASKLEMRLQKFDMRVRSVGKLPRPAFLRAIADARVTVFLPNQTEGFYLPALEGMYLETIVVCPDCIGNRSFCRDEITCFVPPYEEDNLCRAASIAANLDDAAATARIVAARDVAKRHDISIERSAYWQLLDNLSTIW